MTSIIRKIIAYFLVASAILHSAANGLKILGLFPHPGISHFHFFHPIMRGLAEAGHDVTVISHFPDKSPPGHYKDLVLTGVKTLQNTVDLKVFETRRFYNHFLEFFLLYEWGKEACNLTLKSPALQTVLGQRHKVHYDVIIVEQFNTDCMMGVAHVLGSPVIALSSCAMMPWHYARMGNPLIPSYIPALFLGQSEDMGFLSRVANWISLHGLRYLYSRYSDTAATEMLRHKFGHDLPDVSDLVKEVSLYFVNQHYSMSGAKPLSPSVIELGGIHIQKARNIDVEIQRFLDSADHGIIYISWGSMIRADTLPFAKRDAILRAVKRLKQKVIWKWENDTLTNQPLNMMISKWLPQREILCHPNVKVFMTHAGLMGSSEAAYCGVPVVATPMYGDQFLNAAAMVHREMGVVLHYEDITETNVVNALRKTLSKKYMDNAKAVSYSYKHRPMKSLETAIWWVEHVARTEGSPLTKSVSTYLSGFVYYSLDVYLFFICILAGSVYSWIWVIRKLLGLRKLDPSKLKRQ